MAGIHRRTLRPIEGFDHVVQSLYVIFATRLGSRVMLRHFGSGLVELLGRRITPRLVSLYITVLALAIDTWEPRLQVVAVQPYGNTVDAVRLGALQFEVLVYYRPNGHRGDLTIEGGLRRLVIGSDTLGRRITVDPLAA